MNPEGSWNETLTTGPARRLIGEKAGILKNVIIRSNARTDPDVYTTSGNATDVSVLTGAPEAELNLAGKEFTLSGSLMATVGETAERYACFQTTATDSVRDSYDGMLDRGHDVVGLDYLQSYPDEMLEDHWLESLTATTSLNWVPGVNLSTKEKTYAPKQLVVSASATDDRYFLSSTNGAACSESLTTALRRSIEEVIERDAFFHAWYTRSVAVQIDLDEHPSVTEQFPKLMRSEDMSVELYGLDSPAQVSTVLCVLQDRSGPQVSLGTSASLSVTDAMTDAIREAVMIREMLYRQFVEKKNSGWDSPSPDGIGDNLLYYNTDGRHEKVTEILNVPTGSLEGSSESPTLDSYVRAVADAGCSPIAFDITPTDVASVGWSVTKVVIPELIDLHLPTIAPVEHPRLSDASIEPLPHPLP